VAARGNNDRAAWAAYLAEWEMIQVEDVSIYMLHGVNELEIGPAAAGWSSADIRIQPHVEERNEVLFVNPGSASPEDFKLPVTVARLRIKQQAASVEIVDLAV